MNLPRPSPASASRIAGATLGGLLGMAVVYFIALHRCIISQPGPQEAREAAIPLMTGLILSHGHPYTLATLPAYTDMYGIVYNYAVLPAALIWGPTFAVHRAASLLFLALGAVMIYAALRREEVNRGLALAGAAFFYLLNGTTYAIVARPDTLGDVLFLAVFLLVLPSRGEPPSRVKLALSAALGVLAFYTKPYFVLSVPLAAGVLFASAGRRRALGYAGAAAAMFLVTLPLVYYFWPYYLFCLVFVNEHSTLDNAGFFVRQLADFLILHAGILAAAILACAIWARRPPDAPRKVRLDPWILALVLAALVVALVLGSHTGAFRTYWVQLVTPFLIVVAVRAVARLQNYWRAFGLGLLAFNALALVSWARPAWPEDSAPAWAQWRILTADRPWQLLPSYLLSDTPTPGIPVIDNGQSTYFANAAHNFLSPDDPANQRAVEYAVLLHRLILLRRFDVIVTPNDFNYYAPKDFLQQHYDPYVVEFPVYFLQYWAPDQYGWHRKAFTAWLRKPGPEHAPLTAAPPTAKP